MTRHNFRAQVLGKQRTLTHLLQDMWSHPLDFWIKTWHFGHRQAFRTGCPRFFAHILSDLSPLQNSLHVNPWCQGAWQAKHQTNWHLEQVTFNSSGRSSLSSSVVEPAKSGWWWIREHPGHVLIKGFCSISTLNCWYFSKISSETSSSTSSSVTALSQFPSGQMILTMASSIFDRTCASKHDRQIIPEQQERMLISFVSKKQTIQGIVILFYVSSVFTSIASCDLRKIR